MNNICKYCLDDDALHSLIYPCKCSTGVHSKCLISWLLVKPNDIQDICEICRSPYIIRQICLEITRTIPIEQYIIMNQIPPPNYPPPTILRLVINDLYIPRVRIQRNCVLGRYYTICQCNYIECGFYISGTLFGLIGSIISNNRDYNRRNETNLAIVYFIVTFIGLYLVGFICTCKRYYNNFIERRIVHP